MNFWFREDAHFSESPQFHSIPRRYRAAAWLGLSAIKGWCSRWQSPEIPRAVALAKLAEVGLPGGKHLIELLTAAAFLLAVGESREVLRLAHPEAISRPSTEATERPGPKSGADRTREWREKRREEAARGEGPGRGADTEPEPGDGHSVTERHSGDVGPVTERHGERHGGDAPPPGPLSPSEAQKQSQTPETSPPMVTDDVTPASSPSPSPAPSPAASPAGGGEPVAAEIRPKPLTAEQRRRRIEAYGEGIKSATSRPWASKRREDSDDLDTAIEAHSEGRQGTALRVWLVSTAQAYAKANVGRERYERGFAPGCFLAWLNAGSPAAPAPSSSSYAARPSRTAPPQSLDPGPQEFAFQPLVITPETP